MGRPWSKSMRRAHGLPATSPDAAASQRDSLIQPRSTCIGMTTREVGEKRRPWRSRWRRRFPYSVARRAIHAESHLGLPVDRSATLGFRPRSSSTRVSVSVWAIRGSDRGTLPVSRSWALSPTPLGYLMSDLWGPHFRGGSTYDCFGTACFNSPDVHSFPSICAAARA